MLHIGYVPRETPLFIPENQERRLIFIIGGEYGIGKHIWSVPEDDVLQSMKVSRYLLRQQG